MRLPRVQWQLYALRSILRSYESRSVPVRASHFRSEYSMLMHDRVAAPDGGLQINLRPVEHEWHIVVLGNSRADLMYALLRAGAPRVTHLWSHEGLETESAKCA
jgi:hypothetical protein